MAECFDIRQIVISLLKSRSKKLELQNYKELYFVKYKCFVLRSCFDYLFFLVTNVQFAFGGYLMKGKHVQEVCHFTAELLG